MKINYFNPEHVHALIDLPTNKSIEEVVQLLKGSSSHWINEKRLLRGRFSWGRGYGAFSVSHSHVEQVAAYIADQEKHHRKKTFNREFETLVEKYGLEWFEEGNR
jgi:REP element-mobilizing transposase RayT